jgi:hypothetical protein
MVFTFVSYGGWGEWKFTTSHILNKY